MAKELGLNQKKFGKLANNKQEPCKASLPGFIADIYYKRFVYIKNFPFHHKSKNGSTPPGMRQSQMMNVEWWMMKKKSD